MQSEIPKIKQESCRLTANALDIHSNAIILLPREESALKTLSYGGEIAPRRKRAGHKLDSGKPFVTDLPNKSGTHIALAGIDPQGSAFELLTLARRLVATHSSHKPERIAIACHELKPKDAERAVEAVLAALLAAHFTMPDYKSKPDKPTKLREIHIYGHTSAGGHARTIAEAKGNNLARYLTALPPNELTPGNYRRRIEKLAREYGWKTEFLDIKKLKARGAGSFLAVAQGSPEPDAGILHLRYVPKKKSNKPTLALVGKGICFDTGGTNLKPARHMHGMHEDMEGSAVALGTLLALTELKADFPVDCWLALAQNHISPKAYKQNDIVKALNGTTIEIIHTDAEGRMVLADTLTLASRAKPDLMIDFATLTGSMATALGARYSGVLGNRDELVQRAVNVSKQCGERLCAFPMDEDYEAGLESKVADIKQCAAAGEADHILAARFLKRFVESDVPWLHIDLSSSRCEDGLGIVASDVTGFGVAWGLGMLQ
ncbi:MAG: leucyl aminopeptidase family protein [Gallionella sp.]|nr:leucyl aminopeptidase family protein [Gallionella sp.]